MTSAYGKTAQRGRPALDTSPALRRTGTRIVIRVSQGEYTLLKTRAMREGDSIAGVVREALYNHGIDVFAAPSSISGQPPT